MSTFLVYIQLQSLRDGAAGYCGIMCNYHPSLYSWLCENYKSEREKAELVQAMFGTFSFTEVGLPYPLTAKYHMCLEGIPTEITARNRKAEDIERQLKEDKLAEQIAIPDIKDPFGR